MNSPIYQSKNITLEIGTKPLLSASSLIIYPKDKIGLVGRNGTGKTTILNHILKTSNTNTGYVPQITEIKENITVYWTSSRTSRCTGRRWKLWSSGKLSS